MEKISPIFELRFLVLFMLITSIFTAPAFVKKHAHSGETLSQHVELVSVEFELQHQTDQTHHVHSCGMCHLHGYATAMTRLVDVFTFPQSHVGDLEHAELFGFPTNHFRPPRA